MVKLSGELIFTCESRVKIPAQEERRKRQEHFGDITIQVAVLVVEWESKNILLGKMVRYVSKL